MCKSSKMIFMLQNVDLVSTFEVWKQNPRVEESCVQWCKVERLNIVGPSSFWSCKISFWIFIWLGNEFDSLFDLNYERLIWTGSHQEFFFFGKQYEDWSFFLTHIRHVSSFSSLCFGRKCDTNSQWLFGCLLSCVWFWLIQTLNVDLSSLMGKFSMRSCKMSFDQFFYVRTCSQTDIKYIVCKEGFQKSESKYWMISLGQPVEFQSFFSYTIKILVHFTSPLLGFILHPCNCYMNRWE